MISQNDFWINERIFQRILKLLQNYLSDYLQLRHFIVFCRCQGELLFPNISYIISGYAVVFPSTASGPISPTVEVYCCCFDSSLTINKIIWTDQFTLTDVPKNILYSLCAKFIFKRWMRTKPHYPFSTLNCELY